MLALPPMVTSDYGPVAGSGAVAQGFRRQERFGKSILLQRVLQAPGLEKAGWLPAGAPGEGVHPSIESEGSPHERVQVRMRRTGGDPGGRRRRITCSQ